MDKLDIIETLKAFPAVVAGEVSGLSQAQLQFRASDGSWSINETVGYLAEHAAVEYRQFFMIWSMFDPLFPPHGESISDKGFQDADINVLLQTFAANRLRAVEVLMEAVDWTKLGQQRGVGRRTLRQFAELAISNDQQQLAKIRALKTAQNIAVAATA